MAKFIMGIGIPGSGKTTFLRKFAVDNHCEYISSDDVRAEMTGSATDMTTIRVEGTGIDKMQIVHKCIKCAAEKNNKIQKDDSIEAVAQVAKDFAKEKIESWKLKR